jgi:transposase
MLSWMRVPGLSASEKIKNLENENEKLRREQERLKREYDNLKQDRTRLERENEQLRHERERLERARERLERARERLERERERLEKERDQLKHELDLARRAAKRQAAPFSKGEPKSNPKRPGRKPGIQYGQKASRAVPLNVDDEIIVPLPGRSPCCGSEIENLRVEKQYQTEIVRKTRVTCFHVHVGNCAKCGRRIQGRDSRQTSDAIGAAASQVGPEALSLAAFLNKDLGIPLGKTTAVLDKAFGLKLTPGGLSQALTRIGAKCEPTCEDLIRQVRASASVTMDESGWKVGGLLWWLWAAVTEDTTVYGIMPGRGYDEAVRLLGADYDGFLIHDGWSIYYKFQRAFHQSCTRHLVNRCNKMLENSSPASAVFPSTVKAILLKGLDLRDRYLDGEVSDHGLASATGRIEAHMARLLDTSYRSDQNRRFAKHLNHEFEHLFTYLKCPGLDATNYRGEQAIRPAVVTRKVWGGNRTPRGARTQEVLTSVFRTSHQRGIDPLPNLTALLRSPKPYVLKFDSLHPARC